MAIKSEPSEVNLSDPSSPVTVAADGIEIAYRLRRLGFKQIDIARELGVSPSVVGAVIHGRKTAHAVATAVANKLESSPEALWPERYRFRPRGPSPYRHQISCDECQAIATGNAPHISPSSAERGHGAQRKQSVTSSD